MQKSILLFVISFIFIFKLSAQNSTVQKLKQHVQVLASDSLEGRATGSEGIEKAREYILNEFQQAGLKPYGKSYIYPFSFQLGSIRVTANNVIGVIEGTDPLLKNEYIVLGAHYDHMGYNDENNEKVIYNGADDNASGTAVLIEIGRKLSKLSLKRSIMFVAFDAEEAGLLGSEYFFKDSVIAPEKIKCMFSLDMVGMYSKNEGVWLSGIKNIANYKMLINEVISKANVNITRMNRITVDRTDTKPFGNNGIPAIHIHTGSKSPYHKPEDDSELLDYSGMDTICAFTSTLVQNISAKEDFMADPSFIHRYKHRNDIFKVAVGIKLGAGNSYFDYSDEFYYGKSLYAFSAGLFTRLKIGKNWAIQPEFLYATSGSKTALGNYRSNDVVIPVYILLGTNNREPVEAYFLAGGYFKYSLSAKAGDEKVDFGTDFNRKYFGLSYGLGMDIMKVQITFVGQYSLTNMLSDNTLGKIYERTFFVTLGYKF